MENNANKTQQIIIYLMELIKSRKIPTNKIMPSEHALMQRFNCSRSVVISAYNKLEALGAIYSIKKRGHFVAENFHNLIKPISFLLKTEQQRGTQERANMDKLPVWIKERNLIFPVEAQKFNKEYYKNGELAMISEQYISSEAIGDDKVDPNSSLVDYLTKKGALLNIVYEMVYEEVDLFGLKQMVVIYTYGYDEESVSIAGKYYINPKYFKFFHHEFSLKS
ncbi:GntR family transcriptional regulator [Mycoplasma sp. Ms02]|uniref:GntR family transcriptional regulator n=1 Tax=Mycoplasma sp. Ms02 TaxID=353851 RepID=UPI001C89A824|nr:GntR family transcriptional regulator [Mycoplasma sp. Ms02]QZE12626.1 GntR family transcriptional regulator [Mycoplasma sp. Ms02]